MDYFPGRWGEPRSGMDVLEALGSAHKSQATEMPQTHTTSPIMTGTSVVGIKYKDGIMLAADTLSSYGSMARFRDTNRLLQVGDNTVIGASGEVSDFQYVKHMFAELMTEEFYMNDGSKLNPENIYEYLSRVMYARRSKIDPLWNSFVVGGVKNGNKFLGYVDLRGTTYQSSTIATGYGAMIGQPILRKAVEGKEDTMTEEEAKEVVEKVMKVLFYRDARSLNKITLAKITEAGVTISEPYSLPTDWTVGTMVRGYGSG